MSAFQSIVIIFEEMMKQTVKRINHTLPCLLSHGIKFLILFADVFIFNTLKKAH
jgi:hypothetical protein